MYGDHDNRVRTDALRLLDGKDEKLLGQLWDWIYAVFQKWKIEHGDRNPIPRRGLLSDLLPIEFDKAEPWECADFIVSSPVALAMKLMREDYPAFTSITEEAGIDTVLALAIVKSADVCEADLIFAGELLTKHRTAIEMGIAVLNANRTALTAQQSRTDGGNVRAAQLGLQKDDKYRRIREAEKKLAPTTPRRHLNKCIAKETGLPTDYVYRARKELSKTGGS